MPPPDVPTPRHAAAHAPEGSVDRWLVEGVRDHALYFVEPGGHIATWNRGAERIKGWRAEQIVGQPIEALYAAEDVAAGVPARLLAAAAAAGFHEAEGPRVRADGSRFWATVTVTSVRDDAGALRGFVVMTRDSSRLHAMAEALRESEQRFRRVVEDQTEVVCRFLADGTFTFVNEVYCRTFGRQAEQLLGTTWQPVVMSEDLPAVRARLAEMTPTNPVVVIENRVCDASGQVRWMEFVNRGFYSTDGRLLEVQAVGRDITVRRAAEEERHRLEQQLRKQEQQLGYERQLMQSQKLESLGVLAGGIAHDFNNLLTAVLGYASLVRMRLPATEAAHGDLARIEAVALRASELCQQMLAYAGRGQLVIGPVDLNRLAEEMSQLLTTAISKRAVLRFNLLPDLPAVCADATQLRQLVMNLITNASDAIGARSGVISVTTGVLDADAQYLRDLSPDGALPVGRYVYLEVSDNGCGMSDEVRQRIFDPFFTTKFTGRGLGLAAVLGIVRAHKGALKVYTQLGKGTTFKVLLPAIDATADVPPEPTSVVEVRGSGWRVLVVDDEEDVRVLARKVLEAAGFVVVTAPDGRAGLREFVDANGNFDAVLLDLTMPHMAGAETFREMRRVRGDARIVLTSGFAEEEATSGFSGKGLAGFLRKPFRAQALLAQIQHALAT